MPRATTTTEATKFVTSRWSLIKARNSLTPRRKNCSICQGQQRLWKTATLHHSRRWISHLRTVVRSPASAMRPSEIKFQRASSISRRRRLLSTSMMINFRQAQTAAAVHPLVTRVAREANTGPERGVVLQSLKRNPYTN